MIDYLAALLGEQVEEETVEALSGRQVAVRRKRTATTGGQENAGGERNGEALPGEERETDVRFEETDDWQGAAPGLDTLAAVEGEDRAGIWLAETRAGREGGNALYEALGRTARVARLAGGGRETVTVTLPSGPVEHSGEDWSALDRAVQRDARRYDGGFALY